MFRFQASRFAFAHGSKLKRVSKGAEIKQTKKVRGLRQTPEIPSLHGRSSRCFKSRINLLPVELDVGEVPNCLKLISALLLEKKKCVSLLQFFHVPILVVLVLHQAAVSFFNEVTLHCYKLSSPSISVLCLCQYFYSSCVSLPVLTTGYPWAGFRIPSILLSCGCFHVLLTFFYRAELLIN